MLLFQAIMIISPERRLPTPVEEEGPTDQPGNEMENGPLLRASWFDATT